MNRSPNANTSDGGHLAYEDSPFGGCVGCAGVASCLWWEAMARIGGFTAFPDLNISVENVISEGDQAVSRYTARGTHQGETEEFGPATGRQVEIKGITIHRFEEGKIVEEWEAYDNLSVLQQLGLVPEQ
ncbi:MAG TPA: ester cyclase [Rubrobacter sp.]|nr:ester cyclase [Rubrobacter sp.]